MKKYKGVIFFDIDGTLTDSGHGKAYPSDPVVRAVLQAKDNGYACVICTGRNMNQVSCMDVLKPDGYVFSDGAGILITGRKPLTTPFNEEVLRNMLKQVESYHGGMNISSVYGFYATSYAQNIAINVVKKMTEDYPGNQDLIRHDFLPEPIEKWKGEPVLETDLYFPTEEDEQAWLKEKDTSVHYMHMSVTSEYANGEATPAGVSKGEGCRKITELLGCSMQDTYAFGDSMNDISAIETVHTGIVMGNGPEELKKIADYVTDDVQNDGIVSGLKHFHII